MSKRNHYDEIRSDASGYGASSQNGFTYTTRAKRSAPVFLGLGFLLLILEFWKQCYLYFIYFGGHYNVWYVPFQLCSLPMYLCLLYGILARQTASPQRTATLRALAVFLQDFALLGGVAALLVPAGFTYPTHPLLTLHGYVWHLLLIALSLYIHKQRLAPLPVRAFASALPIFLCGAAIAIALNVLLHPFGDCDMFYLSPYHLSSQPVFHTIDGIVGRPIGMLIYLAAVILGAFVLHCLYALQTARHTKRSSQAYKS